MASTSTGTSPTTQSSSSLDGAAAISREELVDLLNEDLAREYQAIILAERLRASWSRSRITRSTWQLPWAWTSPTSRNPTSEPE
jgi:hypothetical protein